MMGPDFLDRHSRQDSPIHRLPAWGKLAAALLLIAVVILPARFGPLRLGLVAAILLTVAVVSRVPWRFLLGRLAILEPLVLGVAFLALFQPGGWRLFGLLVLRSTLCLLTMLLLSNTTPFSDLLRVLKKVRAPGLLITTLSLMHRYLFVLADEAQRMRRARMSRTFTSGRSRTWRAASTVISQLFVRASERAERIYAAMSARGWQ